MFCAFMFLSAVALGPVSQGRGAARVKLGYAECLCPRLSVLCHTTLLTIEQGTCEPGEWESGKSHCQRVAVERGGDRERERETE